MEKQPDIKFTAHFKVVCETGELTNFFQELLHYALVSITLIYSRKVWSSTSQTLQDVHDVRFS